MKSPEFFYCRRSLVGACAITTCTWAADAGPDWNATGTVTVTWGLEIAVVETWQDTAVYGLWPKAPWNAGQEVAVVGTFDIGPPLNAALEAPPPFLLEQPAFQQGSWGPDMPLPLEVDTETDLGIQWAIEPKSSVRATLVCDNVDAGESTTIQCEVPTGSGELIVPSAALQLLPTVGCFGSISISAGDFRKITAPSWEYEVAATSIGEAPTGAFASAALVLR
ncbi:MAG: hypothetical protein IPI67_35765 [Myxococcales bacterium]|nr:hypothetical protein [Myxococcales bacterium]